MPRERHEVEADKRKDALDAVPADAPAWITPELIDHTIRTWQPFYGKAQLSPADAVQILVGVGRLLSVLDGR